MQQALKQKIIVYCLLVFSLLVAACAANQSATLLAKASGAASPTIPPTQTRSLPSTPVKVPTIITQPSSTPPIAAPRPTSQSTVNIEIIEVITPTTTSMLGRGKLVYLDSKGTENYIWDLAIGEKTKILPAGLKHIYCGYVNPHRTRLICEFGSTIYLLDDMGRLINYRPMGENFHMTDGWVNNSLFSMDFLPPENYPYYFLDIPTTLYNVYTGEISQIIPDYAPISPLRPLFDGDGPYAATGVGFSPDLSLAIFESLSTDLARWGQPADNSANQEFAVADVYLVLWDRLTAKEVTRVPTGVKIPTPQWSSDGQRVVVAGSLKVRGNYSELFILSRDDKSQMITNLEELFPGTPNEKRGGISFGVDIFSLGWSPDGTHIAFDFRTNVITCRDGCVGIIDIRTRQLQFFRMNMFYMTFLGYPLYRVEWSPDGQQILLSGVSKQDEKFQPAFIFDIEKRIAYLIGEVLPIGWMK